MARPSQAGASNEVWILSDSSTGGSDDDLPDLSPLVQRSASQLKLSQTSQSAAAGPSTQRASQRPPDSSESNSSSTHSASQPQSTAEPDPPKPAKRRRSSMGDGMMKRARHNAGVDESYRIGVSPPPEDDFTPSQPSQSKPKLSQARSTQSDEGIIKPRNSKPTETITLSSDEDEDDNDADPKPPPPRPSPRTHRSPKASSSSLSPAHPRSQTLAPLQENEEEGLETVQPAEEEEDELADDEWGGGEGYQPPSQLYPPSPSPPPRGERKGSSASAEGTDSSEEDRMEVEQALVRGRVDKGKGRADATEPDVSEAFSPGAGGSTALADESGKSPANESTRSAASAHSTPRAQQAPRPMLSSSPSVESTSEADRDHFTSSPPSAQHNSPQTPSQPAQASSSLSPVFSTPARPAPSTSTASALRPARRNLFPFSAPPPPRPKQPVAPPSRLAGLTWQTTSTGQRICVPKGTPILNHDRAPPRPPVLPAARPPVWPGSEFLGPIPACPDAKVQALREEIALEDELYRRLRLDPANGVRPGKLAGSARAAGHAAGKLAAGREHRNGEAKGEGGGPAELELSEVDKLDFSLLDVRDRAGEVIGRIEPEQLLEGYERWSWARKETDKDAPHRQGLEFTPRKESEMGPGHSKAATKKMQEQVEANAAFLLEHKTTVTAVSSRPTRRADATAGPSSAALSSAPPQLNTLRPPLQPASQTLPSGWPSLRGDALAKMRAEQAAQDDDRAFMATLRTGHGGPVGFEQLKLKRARAEAQAKKYNYWDYENGREMELGWDGGGGGQGLGGGEGEAGRVRGDGRVLRGARKSYVESEFYEQ